ncbi:YbhB/YbcL family Raf kinase inhibitor-like protein [Ilumatobacter sp.]|uniref:YbhB/YbcL family Raf kinase inhibitor-like protein n=1 Tax=Ilumatobacter sp. TaxID=1967498 RepID=UPI003B52F867
MIGPLRTTRSVRAACVVGGLALAGLGACDTGDGTRLADPTSPTTLPPPDTSPISTEPLGDDGGVDVTRDPLAGAEELDPVAGGSLVASDIADAGELEIFAPWLAGAQIDPIHTCDGSGVSPPIDWVGLPAGTADVAVSMVDETELSNGRPFIHWVVAGLGPDATGIGEAEVPPGAIQALNFFGDVGYAGPCPPPGETHVYRVTVHALGQQVELVDATPAAELLDFVESVAIASASTTVLASR